MSGIHDDVLKYLPHREPFLFVDEVLNINKGSDIHAIKRPVSYTHLTLPTIA